MTGWRSPKPSDYKLPSANKPNPASGKLTKARNSTTSSQTSFSKFLMGLVSGIVAASLLAAVFIVDRDTRTEKQLAEYQSLVTREAEDWLRSASLLQEEVNALQKKLLNIGKKNADLEQELQESHANLAALREQEKEDSSQLKMAAIENEELAKILNETNRKLNEIRIELNQTISDSNRYRLAFHSALASITDMSLKQRGGLFKDCEYLISDELRYSLPDIARHCIVLVSQARNE